MEKLNVAIIGQGRSGRNIHGEFFKSEENDKFNVVAVVEKDDFRRNTALEEYPGCKVYSDYRELFDVEGIDVVVNASFSQMHYGITKDLLNHKFNVVVEKPMARTYYECLDLIKTADDNGVTLAVFQQTLLSPEYLKASEVINSGKLGEILQISIYYNSLARRWDWQTIQKNVAGGIYNTGPHPVGMGLGLMGFAENTTVAYSKLALALTSGDSDDYAKIIITAPEKPVLDIEVCSNDPYNYFKFKVKGTKGTYISHGKEYKLKYIVDGENPPQPVIFDALRNENGFPMYCSEKLNSHEEVGEIVGGDFDSATKAFYNMLYDNLKNGTPLKVTPLHAAKVINVIETVHAQNPMPVKF